MSKVLWKSLLVSPAVLGATLLVSAGAMATETAASSKAIAPQITEAQISGSQPVEVAPAAEAINSVQEQQAPASASVETSAKVDVTSSTETVADLEAGSKVGVTASQEAIASPEALSAGESSKLWSVPPVAPKVAQSAPDAVPSASGSDDSSVLQQINRYTREGNSNSIDQVTNVSQFSDVRPTDWAYQALRDLVERYGCIAGYPDSTFRGNRAMTRYEFAAGLNACLRQIEKLIAGQGSEVTRADLDKLNQLINQFRAELTTLGTRVDRLDARVGFLEGHQFSTTTKLVGEAILAVTDEFGKGNDTNTIFGDRVRLDLQTSFTGQDKLHTRLAAGNL
ncbi:MAG TPA: iron uptake porin, partial [Candidatus Obscuribacterales bacterium]